MVINLPENVCLILDRLKDYGSIGYVVGGCVRDSFLGREPDDWDITTPLLPGVVENLFQDYQVIETGIKHGTVTVIINNEKYEVTTFRIDGEYSDGRHPDNVDFTDRLEDDLKRRDFTINAMAYNPDTGLVDLFNGMFDIENGIIRCVGNPNDRFHEDGLRILRALRFAITLDFRIENETMYCMNRCEELLKHISKERICTEICKMMQTHFPNSFKTLYPCIGLLSCVSSYFSLDNFSSDILFEQHSLIESLVATDRDDDLIVRLALLVQYIKNPKDVLNDVRLDNASIKSVLHILDNKDKYENVSGDEVERKYFVRKLISEIGYRDTRRLLSFWKARIYVATPINKFYFLKTINKMNYDAGMIMTNNDCCSLDRLDITGDDLIEIGYEPSKEIGDVLHFLLDGVMHDPYKNKKNWLIKWAKDLKESQEIIQDKD